MSKKRSIVKHYLLLSGTLFSFFIFFISCEPQSNEDSVAIEVDQTEDFEMPLEKVAVLQENLEVIKNIISVAFFNSQEFVVVSNNPASVMLYNIDGRQVRKIGVHGKGAYEYVSPALVKTHDERIYVWCSMLTKLFVFEKSGTPVAEYDFNKAIRDFEVQGNTLFFYTLGAFENTKIIEVYDLASGEIVEQFGDKTNNQLLLELHQGAGGMTLIENNFFFSYNHQPAFCKVNTTDWSAQTFRLNDPDFQVIDVGMTPQELLKDMAGNAKYIYGSDMITGMYQIDDKLIMVADVGEIQMENFDILDFSNRKQRFYVFNKNMNLKYALDANADMKFNSGFFSSDGKNLYGIYMVGDKDIEYHLTRIAFDW